MNLEELRDVRRRERRQDSLQPLRESFYGDVADYVAELKTERERAAERADDPFSDPDVRRLTDEIETAEEVVESIYERRVGKVVKHASFAAADMAHDDEGLTEEERDLFDDLVARVRENRERVLDTLAGEAAPPGEGGETGEDRATETETETGDAPPTAESAAADGDPAPDPNDLLAAAMGGDGDDGRDAGESPDAVGGPADEDTNDGPAVDGEDRDAVGGPAVEGESRAASVGDRARAPEGADDGPAGRTDANASDDGGAERTTVRITEDVGEIYGVDDRSYDLASEDVVQLPADNARPLVEKDAAERL